MYRNGIQNLSFFLFFQNVCEHNFKVLDNKTSWRPMPGWKKLLYGPMFGDWRLPIFCPILWKTTLVFFWSEEKKQDYDWYIL